MTPGEHQEAFSKNVSLLFHFLHVNGFDIRIGEAQRTKAQQEIYVQEGKSMTKNSMHLKKCAIDLHIFKNGKWIQDKKKLQEIGDFWESLDTLNRWGGNWKRFRDVPHFERRC